MLFLSNESNYMCKNIVFANLNTVPKSANFTVNHCKRTNYCLSNQNTDFWCGIYLQFWSVFWVGCFFYSFLHSFCSYKWINVFFCDYHVMSTFTFETFELHFIMHFSFHKLMGLWGSPDFCSTVNKCSDILLANMAQTKPVSDFNRKKKEEKTEAQTVNIVKNIEFPVKHTLQALCY